MVNVVEQEIKVKLKAVLEGFDQLKQVKSDIKTLVNQKFSFGDKSETEQLAKAQKDYNKSVEDGVKINRGFWGTLTLIAGIGGSIGDFISGLIKAFQYFGVTGSQVLTKLKAVYSTFVTFVVSSFGKIKSTAASFLSSLSGQAAASGGVLASLGAGFSSLFGTVVEGLPALASAGAGLAAVGVIGGAVLAVIVALAAGIAAVATAAGSVALLGTVGTAAMLGLASAGFAYNAAIEQAELGTGALIAQLSELKNNGIKLEGIDAVNAGVVLAQEQLKKLRVDAIQTTATFEQLADIYQAAVGSGLGAGLDLDQIRQITVQLAQAGAALGVPYDQMRQEINSILEGTIDINSRIAKNLGISNEQVKKWKEQGTLAEELNKKLVSFSAAGVKAAQTLTGLKSNLQEALNVFTGEATTKSFEKLKERLSKILNAVFDFKAGGLDKAFKPIAELIDRFLVDGIDRFADGIETAVGYAKKLGLFIQENRKVIGDILSLIDTITRNTVGLIGDFFTLTTTTNGWKGVLDVVKRILEFINGLIVVLRNLQEAAYRGWLRFAGAIDDYVLPALNRIIDTIPALRLMLNLLGAIADAGKADADKKGVKAGFEGTADTSGLSYKGVKNPGKGGGKGKSGKDAAKELLDAQEALEEARIEILRKKHLEFLNSEQSALEISYRNRLKSTEDYYDKLTFIAQQEITAERLKEQKLLAIEERRYNRAKSQADKLKSLAKIETYKGNIEDLITRQNTKTAEIDNDRKQAVKSLNTEYQELADTLKEIELLGFEAAASRIDAKYQEILERANIDGKKDIAETIEKIKAHEKTVAKLTDNEIGYNNALARRDDALEKLNELVERGAITEELAGERRIAIEREYKGELLDVIEAMILLSQKAKDFDKEIALRAAKRKIEQSGDFTTPELLERERAKFDRLKASLSVATNVIDNQVDRGEITPELGRVKQLKIERELQTELQKSVDLMRELARATASLDDDLAVEQLAAEIQNLGVETDTLGKGIIDALRGGIGGFFDDLIGGTQSVMQSFRSMVASILASIARLAANELLRSLFASGGGANGGQSSGFLGGALGFLSKLKFADGGHIRGGGTSVSDSIPIMASNDEFMIKAATVRKLGVPFLNWLNNGGNINRLLRGYATGGVIGGSQPSTAGESAQTGGGVRIINVIDPALVKDYLNTSAGESSILNVIKRNPAFIQQLLAR